MRQSVGDYLVAGGFRGWSFRHQSMGHSPTLVARPGDGGGGGTY